MYAREVGHLARGALGRPAVHGHGAKSVGLY